VSTKILKLRAKPVPPRRVPNQITAPEALRIAIAPLTELAAAVRSATFGALSAEEQAETMEAASALVLELPKLQQRGHGLGVRSRPGAEQAARYSHRGARKHASAVAVRQVESTGDRLRRAEKAPLHEDTCSLLKPSLGSSRYSSSPSESSFGSAQRRPSFVITGSL
jgi:hypothetical protein